MTTMYWHLPGLMPGVTYYWRVDEIELDGTVYPGRRLEFLLHAEGGLEPVPADGEPYMDPNLTLSWKVGLNAISHDVYFGADQANGFRGHRRCVQGQPDD